MMLQTGESHKTAGYRNGYIKNLINHNQVGEVALLHKENNDQYVRKSELHVMIFIYGLYSRKT